MNRRPLCPASKLERSLRGAWLKAAPDHTLQRGSGPRLPLAAHKFLDGLCWPSASTASSACQEGAAPRPCPPGRSRPSRQLREVTQRLGQSPVLRVPNLKPRIRKAETHPAFSPGPCGRGNPVTSCAFTETSPGGREEGSPMLYS